MSLNAFASASFASQTPFVDPKTGFLTIDGFKFLLQQWNRTGKGTGIVPIVSPALALTAQQTTQATALSLTADWNDIETVVVGSGVVIPQLQQGQGDIRVFNGHATSANVWPPVGAQIDALGVNQPFVLATNKFRVFDFWSATQLRSWGN